MTDPETGGPGCPFCIRPGPDVFLSNGIWYARFDRHPVTPGHLLVIPVRHCTVFSDLNADEMQKLLPFIRQCQELLNLQFHPLGYNIGTNIGIIAGQSVRHIHVHVIPRYTGDTPDPRGGIRSVVPKNTLLHYNDNISAITGIAGAACIEESFADLLENVPLETFLRSDASGSVLITDMEDTPLALALNTPDGWQIGSALLNGQGVRLKEKHAAAGGRTCRTTRDLWIRTLKAYYSRRIISTTPPVTEMKQEGRAGLLADLLRDVLGGHAGSSCLDCCCGPGIGSEVSRSFGLKPVSYDNMPSMLALGFLRGRLREDETCCIDATIASRYLEPVEFGLGLMLGDINATNAGIWERIVQDLLALSRTTVITVVTEREALRVDHWCRDVGRKSEVFENPRHPFLDRWVCLADPRR